MKKIIFVCFFIFSSLLFANNDLGVIQESELVSVGVKKENIKKAKELIASVENSYKIKVLEKKQLELEVNKLIVSNPEGHLKQIDAIFDKMSAIDAAIMKERVRSQIAIQQYITNEQYARARDLAMKRLNK